MWVHRKNKKHEESLPPGGSSQLHRYTVRHWYSMYARTVRWELHTCHPEMSWRRYEKQNPQEGRLPEANLKRSIFITPSYIKPSHQNTQGSLLVENCKPEGQRPGSPGQSAERHITEWLHTNDAGGDLDKQAPPTMRPGMDTANRHQKNGGFRKEIATW